MLKDIVENISWEWKDNEMKDCLNYNNMTAESWVVAWRSGI